MSSSEFAPFLESFWTALGGDPAAHGAIEVDVSLDAYGGSGPGSRRTAKALIDRGTHQTDPPFEPESGLDTDRRADETSGGPARRLRPPVAIERTRIYRAQPATALGSATASC